MKFDFLRNIKYSTYALILISLVLGTYTKVDIVYSLIFSSVILTFQLSLDFYLFQENKKLNLEHMKYKSFVSPEMIKRIPGLFLIVDEKGKVYRSLDFIHEFGEQKVEVDNKGKFSTLFHHTSLGKVTDYKNNKEYSLSKNIDPINKFKVYSFEHNTSRQEEYYFNDLIQESWVGLYSSLDFFDNVITVNKGKYEKASLSTDNQESFKSLLKSLFLYAKRIEHKDKIAIDVMNMDSHYKLDIRFLGRELTINDLSKKYLTSIDDIILDRLSDFEESNTGNEVKVLTESSNHFKRTNFSVSINQVS